MVKLVGLIVGRGLRRKWFWAFMVLAALSSFDMGCSTNSCAEYFQRLKTNCRLSSTTEGAKLDQFLAQPFRQCQIAICDTTSPDEINCLDPNTHIPGGMNGGFETCQDTQE